ncbi:unnamed protein product [Caenorhabditis sp. 36 PRJEB53466]|nr:unnamed protein product [Caenorhabditis sp. 36 PRJEB53466]
MSSDPSSKWYIPRKPNLTLAEQIEKLRVSMEQLAKAEEATREIRERMEADYRRHLENERKKREASSKEMLQYIADAEERLKIAFNEIDENIETRRRNMDPKALEDFDKELERRKLEFEDIRIEFDEISKKQII